MMTSMFAVEQRLSVSVPFSSDHIARLQRSTTGSVLLPDHPEFEAAWQPWSIGVVHQPFVIVMAETAEDIVDAVTFARDFDLPVSVQATGHGAHVANIGGMHINTSRMTGVTIDADAQTARVEAGAKWSHVLPEAQKFGLAPLSGSTSDVGVVGYSLGGGTGWLARKYGFAADHILAMDVVTATGEFIRVSADSNPDLFWAMRGGSGNFGIVTAMEFRLFPHADFFGGSVFYPLTEAPQVFAAYNEWIETLPSDVTASIAIFRFPPVPFIPEPLQGAEVIKIAAVAVCENGEELIAPMRSITTPLMDGFARMPFSMIDMVSGDPTDPTPVMATSMTFEEITPECLDEIMRIFGPGAQTPILGMELRFIRGAAEVTDVRANAANRVGGSFILFAVGVPFTPEMGVALQASLAELKAAMAPFSTGKTFLNFLEGSDSTADRTADAFSLETYSYLARVKAKHDPTNRFRFNRNIQPDFSSMQLNWHLAR
jgi:UDP-N-acetylenolpyruvoylglucosamine reductase